MLTVNYDEMNKSLVMTGEMNGITRKPLVATFIRAYKGILESDSRITFPVSEENVLTRYQGFTDILARYGIEVSPSASISDTMKGALEAEANFEKESRYAEDIWNRRLDTDEFKNFVRLVSNRCTGRRFYRLQLLSAYHLAFSQHVANFSVPGAGKTSIVYAAYAYLNSLPESNPKHVNHLLVIGPLSSFKAWEDEFESIFSRRPRSRRLIGAVPAATRKGYLTGVEYGTAEFELTLTSYQTLSTWKPDFETFLSHPSRRVMMVLDEAHHIKKNEGEWAAAALQLAPKAKSRIVLTGTPAPNGYEDLKNLFDFIHPNRKIVGFHLATLKAMTAGANPTALQNLKSSIRPFYTRIRKSDFDPPLPASEENAKLVPMGSKQDAIYKNIEARVAPFLRQSLNGGRSSTFVTARLIRLRQAAVNPELLLKPIELEMGEHLSADAAYTSPELEIEELVKSFDPMSELARLDETVRLVAQILKQQGKVLVWSYFIGNLALLKTALGGLADYVEIISGSTPVESASDESVEVLGTREKIIDQFLNTNRAAILIANPQAVGESISLHKGCHTAIYFDRDFNAGRFMQSKDRIHRYGLRADQLTAYHYVMSEDTVDQDIHARLALKERRLLNLIESEDIPLFGLADDGGEDADDIRQIIKNYELRKAI